MVAETPTPDDVSEGRGSSFAAEIERDQEHRAKAKSIRPLRRLAPYVLRYPATLGLFVVFLILASVLTLALPASMRLVVDCGFGDGSAPACKQFSLGGDLAPYFGAGIVVALLLGAASAMRFYFISRLGERVVADLRKAVYAHLLTLSPGNYARIRTGEVMSRLTTDTTLIETLVGSSISVALRTLATTFGAIVLMLTVSWKLTAMVATVGPLILGPIFLFGRRLQRLSRSSQDSLAAAASRAGESLNAIEAVQAFTRETAETRAFDEAVEGTFAVALRRIRTRTFMTALIFSLILTGLISVLWFGAEQVKAGAITPGAMTQFVMYAFIAVSGAGLLTETYAEVMRAAGATERLMELTAMQPEVAAPTSTPAQRAFRGAIAFENVVFAYPARPDSRALRGVSFTIAPGETVALVGPSGAGKSTIFNLLLRFYDPVSGAISLDGADIRSFPLEDLRGALAIVQQNAPLFTGDAALNIRYGRPDATDADVEAAARAANAHDFIAALPQGYKTTLGQSAAQLSGGQRQRIAIARAILKNAPILLLDEATSALDSESEHAIQAAFERISKGRTTLVIAHRLSTVLRADRILVFDDGRITDEGRHADLVARGGLYARLADLQFNANRQAAE